MHMSTTNQLNHTFVLSRIFTSNLSKIHSNSHQFSVTTFLPAFDKAFQLSRTTHFCENRMKCFHRILFSFSVFVYSTTALIFHLSFEWVFTDGTFTFGIYACVYTQIVHDIRTSLNGAVGETW